MNVTLDSIQTLEEASNLFIHALRRSAQAERDRAAGAAEYDSWLASFEYESWTAAFDCRPGRA